MIGRTNILESYELCERVRSFVDSLAEYSSPDVFNPYRDVCPFCDTPSSPATRRKNLERLLHAASNSSVHSLWVGRDLGYLGGRRTGMALTDESHLPELARRFNLADFQVSTVTRPVPERTASAIWGELSIINEAVFLWNVFPFHPHEPKNPLSNRSHSRFEREIGLQYLRSIIDLLEPGFLVAVGRDAEVAMTELDLQVFGARHPSYGGQKIFRSQIRKLYGTNDRVREPELPLLECS